MDTATKRTQEVLRKADYMQVNLHRATKHSEAQRLQTELNMAIKKVAELNEAQQQAQFDYECLENKLKYIRRKRAS